MLERWAKIGCENATVGKNVLKRNHTSLPLLTIKTGPTHNPMQRRYSYYN